MSSKMANVQINQKQFADYLEKIGVVPTLTEQEKMKTRAQNIMDEVVQLFEHGKGNDDPSVKGTVWTAFNAVTEYVDHYRTARSKDNEREARAKSLLFGSGQAIKQAAWDQALVLAKN